MDYKVLASYLKEYGFVKTEQNEWLTHSDYILKEINGAYGYYLKCIIRIPRNKSTRIDYNNCALELHRYYDPERKDDDGENSKVIYDGLIESKEDLDFILKKTQILCDHTN